MNNISVRNESNMPQVTSYDLLQSLIEDLTKAEGQVAELQAILNGNGIYVGNPVASLAREKAKVMSLKQSIDRVMTLLEQKPDEAV